MINKKHILFLLFVCLFFCLFTMPVQAEDNAVAKVNDTSYTSLDDALQAIEQNAGGTIILLDDITISKKYEIKYDTTISGNFTIYRGTDYADTLFLVEDDTTLTLDGITYHGGATWTLDKTTYSQYLNTGYKVTNEEKLALVSFTEDSTIATAPAFNVSGSLIANNCLFTNNFSKSSNQGIVYLVKDKEAIFELNNTIVEKSGSFGGSAICGVSKKSRFSINEGSIIRDCHFGLNGGISRSDNGLIEMNSGVIKNNTACDANGYIFMVYGEGSILEMNGGIISDNSGCKGPANGFNSPLYMHSQSKFILNNGEISRNIGYSSGGVYIRSNSLLSTITGDNVKIFDNIAIASDGAFNDIYAADVQRIQIYAGQYTQDITEWLAPNRGVIYNDEGKETYTVTTDIAELNGVIYSSVQEAVDAAKKQETVKLLCNSMIPGTIEIKSNDNLVLDMNNKKLYSNLLIHTEGNTITTENIDVAMEVKGHLTIKNGSIISHKSNGKALKVSGFVSMENVNCKGLNTAIENNNYGKVIISSGTFEAKESGDSTPTISENLLTGNGTYAIRGGTFKGYNPGIQDNYVATDHISELTDTDNSNIEYYTVRALNISGEQVIYTEESRDVTITYGMSESFIVIIPADFNINIDGTAEAEIEAVNIMLEDNKTLEVSIKSINYTDTWNLLDILEPTNKIKYKIGTSANENNINNNDIVLSVNAGEAYDSSIVETMYFTLIDNVSKAGTYIDRLTFTANVK